MSTQYSKHFIPYYRHHATQPQEKFSPFSD